MGRSMLRPILEFRHVKLVLSHLTGIQFLT
jgi:hypothetical protein